MAVLLTAGALAGPALARQGTGLYAPFPSPPDGAQAQGFVGQLGVRATPHRLDRGFFLPGSHLATSRERRPATYRARPARRSPGPLQLGALPGLLLVAALAAGGVAMRLRPARA